MAIETTNVFIDTQAFEAGNFNFKSNTLCELVRLADAGEVSVFITTVTKKEIEGHIRKHMRNATTAHKKFRDEARILRNLPNIPQFAAFNDFDENAAAEKLLSGFEDFLKQAKVTVLDTSKVDSEALLERYFKQEPPFDETKKKNEFPDAFAAACLASWCSENRQKMYVASADGDWRRIAEAGDQLIPLGKIEEFLSLYLQQKKQSDIALRLFEKHQQQISEQVAKEFQQSGFFLEDEEGDVNNVTLRKITLSEPLIIEVDEGYALLNVSVDAHYEAEVSYEDYANGIWDSEDHEYAFVPTEETTVEESNEFDAEITLEYDPENPDETLEASCSIPADFGITVQPTDYELK